MQPMQTRLQAYEALCSIVSIIDAERLLPQFSNWWLPAASAIARAGLQAGLGRPAPYSQVARPLQPRRSSLELLTDLLIALCMISVDWSWLSGTDM